MSNAKKYFGGLMPSYYKRSQEVLRFNPAVEIKRKEPEEIKVDVYDYNADTAEHHEFTSVHHCNKFKSNGRVTWINIDGLRQADVESICNDFGIHPLLIEDILSVGQRAKMDEMDNAIFC